LSTALNARYAHTCIVAADWRRLASFYESVFGCERLLPERDNRGAWVDRLTGLHDARARGVHLRLPVPGLNDAGPTLEIFQFDPAAARVPALIHRPGLAHIAFRVDDVRAARAQVLAAGGHDLGEVVTAEIAGAGTATLVYLTDPEGNIVELQQWD
jgi:catechol 2,3-dioxygenase-like lactoylglutathione lyase family enzyme